MLTPTTSITMAPTIARMICVRITDGCRAGVPARRMTLSVAAFRTEPLVIRADVAPRTNCGRPQCTSFRFACLRNRAAICNSLARTFDNRWF
jgi:hypothetical protein